MLKKGGVDPVFKSPTSFQVLCGISYSVHVFRVEPSGVMNIKYCESVTC